MTDKQAQTQTHGVASELEEDLRMSYKFSFRIAFAAAFLALLVVAPAAYAGKGGGKAGGGTTTGGTSSLTLVLVNSTDGVAHQGQTVTFAVATTATDRPFVRVDCYQGTSWVYAASAGFFPDYPWSKDFPLASNMWTSGAADCTATMYMSKDGSTRVTNLATLKFHVDA
jgi:hypothetical protein